MWGGQECGKKSRSNNPGKGAPNPGRGAPMGIEEFPPSRGVPRRRRVPMECGLQYRSDDPDWGVPVGMHELLYQAEECTNGGRAPGMILRSPTQERGDEGVPIPAEKRRKRRNGLRKDIDESESRLRSANRDWGVPIQAAMCCIVRGGGLKWPNNEWLMSAVASGVKFIIGAALNVPWYSSWENLTVAFIPLAYSDRAQWIGAAASAIVCGTWCWTYWDVIGWRPRLLAVKNSWS